MLMFPSRSESRQTFEDVFFEHHARLNEWAMQLTGRDRSAAEDLVQELYVRFAGAEPIGAHIEDPKDYLFSAMRNLHYARIRRARTSAIDDLSIVDYESAERSLRAADRSGILFIRKDLHRVCGYLCERRNTSRAASVFILRYFLGYYPNEVMKVVRATRGAVDKAIRAARREAQLELERPGVLRTMSIGLEPESKPALGVQTHVDGSHELFLSLRTKIFNSRSGRCFKQASLAEMYSQPGRSFTTAELAHLVSCAECLDRVNRMLGLPLLEERSPDETINRDTPPGPDGAGSGDAMPILVSSRSKRKSSDPRLLRQRLKRSLEEVRLHRPQRLLIAVDGDVRASQKVTAQFSELRVELRPMEKPAFIEVLSEQDICLAFLPVQALAPEGGLQQTREIELSDNRTIRVAVSFTAESPAIQVVYSDPLVGMDEEADAETEMAEPETFAATTPLFGELSDSVAPWKAALKNVPEWLQRRLTHLPLSRMNPLLTGATIFALCSILCFVLWTRSGPAISASSLLAHAQQSDAFTLSSSRAGVIYQKVRITTPGRTMERAIYRDPERKRRPRQQQLGEDERQVRDRLERADVNWDDPLSAANFSAWRDRQLVKRDVVKKTGDNLLTLTTTVVPGGAISEESLTVRESDFHPVARTVKLSREGTVEIAELNYDVMPWAAVNQDWFEPLAGPTATNVPSQPAAIHLPHVLSGLELDEAELAARTMLNQLNADAGEPIHLTRSATGIYARGVVNTEARRQELVYRLALLPNVHASILSEKEIGERPLPRPTQDGGYSVQVYSVEAQPSTLEQYLREKKLPLDQLEHVSQSLLDQALRIQQAETHLSELQLRFKGANQLPPDQQNQLTELTRNYIHTIQSALDENQSTLRSIGLDGAGPATSTPETILTVEDLNHQVRRYQELCQQLITSGTAEPASAAVIAQQLRDSGALIRASAAQRNKFVSTAHN